MKLAVVGFHRTHSIVRVFAELDAIHFATPITGVINFGGAALDEMSAAWADARNVVTVIVCPLDPHTSENIATEIGVLLDLAEMVIVFRAAPGKSMASDDTIAKALDAGKLLRVVEDE